MKKCKRCGKNKSIEKDYYRNHTMKDGHLNICKNCKKEYAKKYRDKNLEKIKSKNVKCMREFRKKHKDKNLEYQRRYKERNKEKCTAHLAVRNALRSGKLKRQECEVKGCKKTNTHGHHDDYSKPLQVRWLCPEHHKLLHRKERKVI